MERLHATRRAAGAGFVRVRALAPTLFALAFTAASCAPTTAGDDPGAPEETTGARSAAVVVPPPPPLPLQSCPGTSVASYNAQPPTLAFTLDPVALLAGAPSLCAAPTNSSPCAPHRVYVPNAAVTRRAPIVVFLPGTQMEPDKHDLVLQMAAYAGYRTIGLAYDNTVSTESACAAFPLCTADCAGAVHREVILGVNATAQRAVARGDSVLERLYRALANLAAIDPAGGWGSYYVPTAGNITPASIVWSNVIIAGFSQGAGHAAAIAHNSQVHGLLVMDGAGDVCVDAAGATVPAAWITATPDLSAGRPKYGVQHRYGAPVPMPVPASWAALGISTGTSMNIDLLDSLPPSHAASTDQLAVPGPAICSQHTSMARDACMPTSAASAASAAAPPDAHLFGVYVRRFCYACDAATCP